MSKRQALGAISLNNRTEVNHGLAQNNLTNKAPFGKTQSFSGKTTTSNMNRVASFSSTSTNQRKSTTNLAKAATTQYNDENKTYASLHNVKKETKITVNSNEYDFDIFVQSQSQQDKVSKSSDSYSHILDFFKPSIRDKENSAPAAPQPLKIDSDEELEQDEEGISKLHIITDTIDATDLTELKSCESNFERMMESPIPFDDTIKYLSKESNEQVESSEEDEEQEVEDEDDEETRKRIESDNILFNLVDYKDDCIT
jgi:hypothetical protein